MQPLDETARRRLLRCSALLCAVPLCLAPLAGRSSLDLAGERAAFDARFKAPPLERTWNAAPVSVARDPFAPDARRTAPAISNATTLAPAPGIVRAVVVGPSPRALVDDGERVRVLAVGDGFAGLRVVSIDARGIRLSNGTALPLRAQEP